MHQDLPDSLDALRSLAVNLNRVTLPDTQLRPFLFDVVQTFHAHWPTLTRFNIYAQQPDHGYVRLAGIGMARNDEPDQAPEALAAQVSARPELSVLGADSSPVSSLGRWLIPLLSTERVIGFVEAEFPPELPVPPVFEPILLVSAAPLALAIDRLRPGSTDDTQPAKGHSTSSLLATLYAISRQIGIGLADPDMLHSICQNLTEALGVDYTAILRFDIPASYAVAIVEHPVRLGQANTLTLDNFGVYRHFQTYLTPVMIENVQTAAAMLGSNQSRFQALNLHAMVIAPLLVQGDLIGGLLLATAERARPIPPDTLHVAQAVATQIALNLRTTEFFTEIQQRANQLERIAAFGRLVTGTLDQTQILQHVMEVVPNLIPADKVGVAFYTLDQNRMRLFESENGITPQEITLTAAGSSIEEVVHHHNPLLIVDLSSSTYTDHQRLVQQGMQAAIIAPLMVSGRMLGAVTVAHKRARTYTPTDLTLLQQIGNQIAIALENAHIFNTARQRATFEEALSEITSHLQEQSDLRMILQQTMSDFGKVLGASHARVRLQVTPSEIDISKLFQPKE